MTIADLGTVWLSANVPEKDLHGIQAGDRAVAIVSAYPEDTIRGVVAMVGAVVDTATRMTKVRLTVPNPRGRLKPGMYATITFAARPRPPVVVPATSLLQVSDSDYVFVECAPGPWSAERWFGGAHRRQPRDRAGRRIGWPACGGEPGGAAPMIDGIVSWCLERRWLVARDRRNGRRDRGVLVVPALDRSVSRHRGHDRAGRDAISRACGRGDGAADHDATRARARGHSGAAGHAFAHHIRPLAHHPCVPRRHRRLLGAPADQ